MQVGADRVFDPGKGLTPYVRVLLFYVTARGEHRTHRVADHVPASYQGTLLRVDISESGFKGWAAVSIDASGVISARYIPRTGGFTTPIPVVGIADVKSPAPLEVKKDP